VAARGYAATYLLGADIYLAHANQYAIGGKCVLDLESASDDCLRLVCWDPKLARTMATELRRRHLGPFAPRAPRTAP
jgi:hypothetical protein